MWDFLVTLDILTSPIKCESLRIYNPSPLTYHSHNQALIPLIGHEGKVSLDWIDTLNIEQSYKWLSFKPKNFEALDLWILSFKVLNLYFSNQCETFYSHLIFQHLLSSVSLSAPRLWSNTTHLLFPQTSSNATCWAMREKPRWTLNNLTTLTLHLHSKP
jgi:hypothetical protein